MSKRFVATAAGRKIAIAELGNGPPLLYLHDFIDIHGATEAWLEFHRRLGAKHRLIAPAHAGCAGSDEDDDGQGIEDVVFHLLETLDLLGLDRVPVVGVGIGGWLAAELAVRHPRMVARLVLIGATGLFLPGQPIADPFFAAQPVDGSRMDDLRRLFFGAPDAALARDWIPDGRLPVDRELLRYQMYRFAARFGFNPPYLYHRRLRERLRRYDGPALVLGGDADGLVPPTHARAYAEGLPQAKLHLFAGAGHSLPLERPEETAAAVLAFLAAAPDAA